MRWPSGGAQELQGVELPVDSLGGDQGAGAVGVGEDHEDSSPPSGP